MAYKTEDACPNIETEMERKRRGEDMPDMFKNSQNLAHALEVLAFRVWQKSLDTGVAQRLNINPPDIFLPFGHPILPAANLVGMQILTTYIRLNCCQVRSGIPCTSIHYTHTCHFFLISGWKEGLL